MDDRLASMMWMVEYVDTNRVSLSLVIIVFYGILKRLIGVVVRGIHANFSDQQASVVGLLGKIASVVLWILTLMSLLGTWGVDTAPLIASIGLSGFALSFALKDLIGNVLSGVLLLLHRPFAPGDMIEVGGITGKILSIDLRYTILSNESGKHFFPNSQMTSMRVTVTEG
ncbi:mechanosensitive ion channel family protein [Candidatus Synchoanobacter obligatus]|uniref:Small-conductance mechanosensitive channel n=1 Tax=Candidatus Synchoanobacter obligatus TaxID=2919597 RepID=A0ABT1L5J1_9GAMM|nr:mechanosensitive ion channel family protein [Candidatus Synchoanobacter obligatus]MCP8352436.1 mechanosensitive ion channel family protein [Candidatus Synchoanobacter obligatus]